MKAKDILNLINKQWASTDDIMSIGEVGYHRALNIKKEIAETLDKKYKLPRNKVPMEFVVDYFKINISYLKKVSQDSKRNQVQENVIM